MPHHPINLLRRRLMLASGLGLYGSAAAPSAAARTVTLPLLLARDWTSGADPSGWLVSEKLDGVRAVWDGRSLRFRSGRQIAAPAAFMARLPADPLDGELWLGRGRFDELSGLVRRSAPDQAAWRELTFQVFELPDAPGPFAQRAASLRRIAQRVAWPQLRAVEQQGIGSSAALQQRLDAVLHIGGEGLMLHHADAPYVTGRNDVLRKLKPVADAEATVLGHLPGRGALAGQTGALTVRDDAGRVFDLGSGLRDAERRAPPPIGSRITYTYRGLTPAGLPRFATWLRPAPSF